MQEHDCIIGFLNDYIDAKLVDVWDLEYHIEEKLYNKYKTYTFSQYADKSCSTDLFQFDFCPLCGEKIDWKAIKERKLDDEG